MSSGKGAQHPSTRQSAVHPFIQKVARMTTGAETGNQGALDGGVSGDDAIATLSALILEARAITSPGLTPCDLVLRRMAQVPEQERGILKVTFGPHENGGSRIYLSHMGADPMELDQVPSAALSHPECSLSDLRSAVALVARHCADAGMRAGELLVADPSDRFHMLMAFVNETDPHALTIKSSVESLGTYFSLNELVEAKSPERERQLATSYVSRLYLASAFGYVAPAARSDLKPLFDDFKSADFQLCERWQPIGATQKVVHVPSGMHLGVANDFICDKSPKCWSALINVAEQIAPGLADEHGAYSNQEKQQVGLIIKQQLSEMSGLLRVATPRTDLPYGGLEVDLHALDGHAPAWRRIVIEYDRGADLYNVHCTRMNGYEFEHVCDDGMRGVSNDELAIAILKANWPDLDALQENDNGMQP